MQRAADLLARAESRRLELPDRGIEVALLDWGGDGPLVLAHHANGFCKGLWAEVAAGLDGRARLVAMDARGHGDTRFLTPEPAFGWDVHAEDALAVARALCAELGRPRIDLGVGHSFGGTSMLGAAARDPACFGGLLLLDPVTPALGPRPPHLDGLIEGARKRRASWPDRAEARAWFAERALFADWTDIALDLYVLDGLGEGGEGVALKCAPDVEATVFSGGGLDVAAVAERVTAPCVWVWAESGDFPRAVHEHCAGRLPAGRFEAWEAGHLIPMEQPERVAEAILAAPGVVDRAPTR